MVGHWVVASYSAASEAPGSSRRRGVPYLPVEGWERLTHDDWSILRLESGHVAGHTCKLIVLEPSERSGRWVELLRAQIAARATREPRLRQRLLITPLGLAPPVWVDDPDFDVANHVVPLRTGQPVEPSALTALAATVMTTRLDRARPLWSIHVIDPLANGGAAVIWRIHHCMADGSAALRFFREVLWDAALKFPRALPPRRGRQAPCLGARGCWRGAWPRV